MSNNNQVHMFIGPKVSNNMTISELNGARALAKYSISRDFKSIEEFHEFTIRFKDEKGLWRPR